MPSAYDGIAGLPATAAAESRARRGPGGQHRGAGRGRVAARPGQVPGAGREPVPAGGDDARLLRGQQDELGGRHDRPRRLRELALQQRLVRLARLHRADLHRARVRRRPRTTGSTGETQLDSARYEINDYQHLAGQLADAGDLLPGAGEVRVDPGRVVPTGGSYGGGFTWLALTDPTWNSPGGAAA